MKKLNAGLLSLLTLAMLVGCGGNSETEPKTDDPKTEQKTEDQKTEDQKPTEPAEKTLVSIAITKRPNKIVYIVGESLDTTGMEVTATYSDSSTALVTDYTVSKTGPLELTDTKITVTYQDKTAVLSINVKPKPAVTLSSIAITKAPDKVEYHAGEIFDVTGMEVTATYSDDSKKIVTGFTVDKTGPLTMADTVVTVSFEGKTATQTITVLEAIITRLELTQAPTKQNYLVGEKFSSEGMVISGVKTDNTKEVITDYTIVDADRSLAKEDTKMVITYETFTLDVPIVVSEAKMTGIVIAQNPDKVNYYVGDVFDPTGMIVKAQYENSTEEVVTEYLIDKTEPLTLEDTTVTITYGEFSATVQITVEVKTDITIDGLKTVRFEAENLDTSNATLRPDFVAAHRGFIENGADASGDANLCGYEPGSSFKITLKAEEDCTVFVSSRMSDTDTGYDLKSAMTFEMDGVGMIPSDVQFTYSGGVDYWNWKNVELGTIALTKGVHEFVITAVSKRPNLDYFQFEAIKYGEQALEKQMVNLTVSKLPTKLSYEEGELFDPTGIELTAEFNTHEREVITEGYSYDKTEALTLGDTEVTFTYQGFTAKVSINVGKFYSLKLNSLGDHNFEAENLPVDDNWIMRQDMINAGFKGFVVDNGTASGGKSIERYAVGTVITLPFYAASNLKLHLSATLSSYDDFVLNDGVEFKIDETTLNSDNPALGHRHSTDWYNWKTAWFDSIDLSEGEHVLKISLNSAQPNLDVFNFHVIQYGEEVEPHTLESIEMKTAPNKAKYVVGETFDPTGVSFMAKYTDTLNETVTEGYTYDKIDPLTVEDKEVTFTCLGQNIVFPITVIAAQNITEATTFRVEAENLDTTNMENNGRGYFENSGFASEGRLLGNGTHGSVELLYNVTDAMTLDMTVAICKYEALVANDCLKIYVDGNRVEMVDKEMTLGRASDGSNDWFNFKTCAFEQTSLTAGVHTIKIEIISCNFDYIDFSFAK